MFYLECLVDLERSLLLKLFGGPSRLGLVHLARRPQTDKKDAPRYLKRKWLFAVQAHPMDLFRNDNVFVFHVLHKDLEDLSLQALGDVIGIWYTVYAFKILQYFPQSLLTHEFLSHSSNFIPKYFTTIFQQPQQPDASCFLDFLATKKCLLKAFQHKNLVSGLARKNSTFYTPNHPSTIPGSQQLNRSKALQVLARWEAWRSTWSDWGRSFCPGQRSALAWQQKVARGAEVVTPESGGRRFFFGRLELFFFLVGFFCRSLGVVFFFFFHVFFRKGVVFRVSWCFFLALGFVFFAFGFWRAVVFGSFAFCGEDFVGGSFFFSQMVWVMFWLTVMQMHYVISCIHEFVGVLWVQLWVSSGWWVFVTSSGRLGLHFGSCAETLVKFFP